MTTRVMVKPRKRQRCASSVLTKPTTSRRLSSSIAAMACRDCGCFDEDYLFQGDEDVAEIEDRNKALAAKLGTTRGTHNVDRLLRLPGTINHPNAAKRKKGRVACVSSIVWVTSARYALSAFPKTVEDEAGEAITDIDTLPISKRMKALIRGIDDPDHVYESRSEAVYAVTVAMAAGGCTDEQIESVLLDSQWSISAHVLEQKDPEEYLERQITKARKLVADSTVLDPQNPLPSARKLIAKKYTAADTRTLHRHRNTLWSWTGSYFRLINDETVRSEIWLFLEKATKISKDGTIEPFKPKKDHVSNVFEALNAISNIDSNVNPPAWLTDSIAELPAAHELLACGNGLLHLPTGQMYQPSPNYFNLSASEVVFDLSAPQPAQWLDFLGQLFGNDSEVVMLLQEWFGYSLSPDTTQQKILFIVGPKRSGKGTIARVLAALLGRDSVAGPTISSLSEQFGLEPLITKPLAIISDARLGARTNKATLTERLLSISGEDRMTVPRKFKLAWTGQLPTRLAILTNELPNFPDGSGALAGRLLVIKMMTSFFGREDPGLSNKLLTELSGILNWSIEGYRRLRGRGHFVQPKSSEETIESIEMIGSPVKAFVRDCCDVRPDLTVGTDEDVAGMAAVVRGRGSEARRHEGVVRPQSSFGRAQHRDEAAQSRGPKAGLHRHWPQARSARCGVPLHNLRDLPGVNSQDPAAVIFVSAIFGGDARTCPDICMDMPGHRPARSGGPFPMGFTGSGHFCLVRAMSGHVRAF